jgi:hypothetical protein
MIIIGTPTAVMENGGNATMTESFNCSYSLSIYTS